jgi:hypothetical protein
MMSKHTMTVADKIFSSKTEALAFYKNILNSYEAGQYLNFLDFQSVTDLYNKNYIAECMEDYKEHHVDERSNILNIAYIVQEIRKIIEVLSYENQDFVDSVMVDYSSEFKKTKCFFLVRGKTKSVFGYRLSISGGLSDSAIFSRACRHIVAKCLREFKIQRFKNKPVKCALTNEIVEWEGCQIDHKSPLTFSVIVKSFIVANKIDVSSIEYLCDVAKEQFADKELADKFDAFHKDMAVLRVLSIKANSKLSASARIKPTKKDGILI